MPDGPEAITLTRSEGVLFDTSDCCVDCPDVNPDPPNDSDCPYFEIRDGKIVCNRSTGLERLIDGGGSGTGVANIACRQVIERVGDQ